MESSGESLSTTDVSQASSRGVCLMDQHCMNDGKCEQANELIDHRHCVCKQGFSGARCSQYCPLECQNKGYCTVKPKGGALGEKEDAPTYDISDYMCKCFGRFTGDLCQIPYTNCGNQVRCLNGGQCNLNTTTNNDEALPGAVPKQCICPPGYLGESCEIVPSEHSEDVEIMEKSQFFTAGKGIRSTAVLVLCFCIIALVGFVWRRKRRQRFQAVQFDDIDDDGLKDDNDREEASESSRPSLEQWFSRNDYSSSKAFELHFV